MLDIRPALTDMAWQIRSCRVAEGYTLQQLATRSGVAASTIHKVESQQMVPTVAVLLKIAAGLGRRADELVRDVANTSNTSRAAHSSPGTGGAQTPGTEEGSTGPKAEIHRARIWRIALGESESLPGLEIAPDQRAILLVEKGVVDLQVSNHQLSLGEGDCFAFEGGGKIQSIGPQPLAASLTVIVSSPTPSDHGQASRRALNTPNRATL